MTLNPMPCFCQNKKRHCGAHLEASDLEEILKASGYTGLNRLRKVHIGLERVI